MNPVCKGLMTIFRILQLLLSLVTLGCGAFITHQLFSMASTAHQIESTIEKLLNTTQRQSIEASMGINFTALHLTDQEIDDVVIRVDRFLAPILHVMEHVPIRGIILTTVSFWSICIIIYLLLAQRATKNAWVNRRFIRITFEFATLMFWTAGIICASLLAVEYGSVVFAGAVPLKVAWSSIEAIVAAAFKKLFEDRNLLAALSIVNDVITIGALSIIAVVAAVICGAVSLVSLIMACFISGKIKNKRGTKHLEQGAPEYLVPLATEKNVGFQASYTPPPAPWRKTAKPLYHPLRNEVLR